MPFLCSQLSGALTSVQAAGSSLATAKTSVDDLPASIAPLQTAITPISTANVESLSQKLSQISTISTSLDGAVQAADQPGSRYRYSHYRTDRRTDMV